MRNRWERRIYLGAIWLAFITRGAFYCVEQPLWEGYDEWAHFAYVQQIADQGTLPSRADAVPRIVDRSLQLAPLSESASRVGPETITHDLFWQLPPAERVRRHEALRRLSSAPRPGEPQVGVRQYEAQQPPLYYLLLTPAYVLTNTLSLPAQVLVLRLLSMSIASCVVFVGYSVAFWTLHRRDLAMLAAILLACLPGLFIDVCRVANDALAIVLISIMVLVLIRACRRPFGVRDWLTVGLLAGAAALTKAYALALLPLLPLVAGLLIAQNPERWKRTVLGFGLACIVVTAVAGWWYWQCWMATGTLSGEQLDVAASRFTAAEKLAALSAVSWRRVADAAAFSHIWVGGWSFLVVRSWMYRIFELIGVVSAIGLAVHAIGIVRHSCWKSAQDLLIPLVAFTLMCVAVVYHALVVFMVQNTSAALGWYLYPVVVPEVVLLALGICALFPMKPARWTVAAMCSLAAALDLYTVHFMLMPYYSGLIRHNASGSLASFKLSMLASADLFQRLSINKPLGAGPIAALWVAYLCATAALIGMAIVIALSRPADAVRT